ncbi:hypothetical protein CDAR_49661 [Caerostris darwini]|nr:hypothetical protein CDAR_49661 [Caerostris darwini]
MTNSRKRDTGLQMNCAPIILNFDIPFAQIIARCPLSHFDSEWNTNIGEKGAHPRVSRIHRRLEGSIIRVLDGPIIGAAFNKSPTAHRMLRHLLD